MDEYDKKLRLIQEENTNHLERMQTEYRNAIRDIERSHGEEIMRLSSRHKAEFQRIEERQSERLERERETARSQREVLQKRFEDQVEHLLKQLNEQRTQEAQSRSEGARATRAAQQKLQDISLVFQEERKSLQERIVADAKTIDDLLGRLARWKVFYSEIDKKVTDQAEMIESLETKRSRLTELVQTQKSHLLEQEGELERLQEALQGYIEEGTTQREQLARANADRHRLSEKVRTTALLAKQEVFEKLAACFDLVRSALPHRDVEETHARIRASLQRLENFGVQIGRPPDAMLSATEAAHLIRKSKRKLQAIDPRDLQYEVCGRGKRRQHRVYRLRDCLAYLAKENSGRPDSKST